MQTLMEQQQTVNQCVDGCVASSASLARELEAARDLAGDLQTRVNATEDAADSAVEQAAQAVTAAERLAFLSEQAEFAVERSFHTQEKKLLEAQRALDGVSAQLAACRAQLAAATEKLAGEAREAELERLAPQWRLVAARDDGDASNDAAGDVAQSHTALSRWGENKSLGEVMRVENWLETVLSGKSVAMEQGANTIELCVFNQEQRACFLQTIVPMIARRKDVECFVQEHLRRESDFRITLIGTEETIPAVSVPSAPVATVEETKPDEESVAKEFVLVPSGSEEEEEIQQEDLEAIHKVMEAQAPQKEKRRKVKMISFD